MARLYIFLLVFVAGSCNVKTEKNSEKSFKDSVLVKYFNSIDSIQDVDTENYNYKILKAYSENDSSFFVKMDRDIDAAIKESRLYPFPDTCISSVRLSDLNADEVFRFYHSQSFCFFRQQITIARNQDSVWLHYVEYGFTDDGNVLKYSTPSDTITVKPCQIIKNLIKRLTQQNWNEFAQLLSDADYWALEPNLPQLVRDGSSWTIDGYTKRPRYGNHRQFHSVSRNPYSASFIAIGKYLLKLSGEKTMCGDFF